MPNLIQDNPGRISRDLQIAKMRMEGATLDTIGDAHGITHQRVSQILSDDKIKAILDRTHRRYAAAASGIGKQFIKLCLDDDKSISTKNISEYHKIMGIAPSHTQSTFIQQIFNTLAVGELDPAVKDLLTMHTGAPERSFTVPDSPDDDEVIDV